MFQRDAGRSSSPWWTLIGAVALTVAAARWCDTSMERVTASGPATSSVELHVKLKPGAALAGSVHAHALFTELPAGTHDGRERWRIVEVATTLDPEAAAAAFARDPAIEDAFPAPTISTPTAPSFGAPDNANDDDSCPIATPSFSAHQEYVGPAPRGIDAPAAWQRGIRGARVAFADVEGGWNATHEDLPGERIRHVHGVSLPDRAWRAHGTAVLGEVVGRDNGKGVVGIAPDVDAVYTSSIAGSNVADAIDAAAEHLQAGDVLLVELQGLGPRGRYLPVEYWDDAYEAISTATSYGIIVIEAAGNGGEDLDLRPYRGRFDRTRRDSGAIIVGAGAPPRAGFEDRSRLDFSNYGSRVDVQGWGRKVATLDYGDLQACDDTRDRHYTGEFSGTSSASPIVAGAAILLESTARRTGEPLRPDEVRILLVDSGTPQTGDTREHIGPRPDLASALRWLTRRSQ